jgi:hypothetical protein
MRKWVWVLVAGVLAGGGACANGLIDTGDGGGVDSSIPDGAPPKDASQGDAIKPGDAGCPPPTKLCGALCFDLQNDPQHCGNCTTICSTIDAGNPGDAGVITAVCNAGMCAVECDGGLSQCGEQCFDEKNDPTHCGDCLTACDGGLCNSGSCCPPGDSICSGTCVDTTSDNMNCGGCGKACDAGTCVTSTCQVSTTYKVGNYTLFSGKSAHSANYLLGSQVTLSKTAKLIDFGLISVATGANVTMALYTDSGGHPGTLVAYTGSTALTASDQQITPNVQASLSATSYWIMAVYNTSASVGIDYSVTTAEVDYISFTYGGTLPSPFGSPLTYTGQRFNYYLVVQ